MSEDKNRMSYETAVRHYTEWAEQFGAGQLPTPCNVTSKLIVDTGEDLPWYRLADINDRPLARVLHNGNVDSSDRLWVGFDGEDPVWMYGRTPVVI